MRTVNIFDIVVVGSSPLLVLFAIHQRKLGMRVCLIEVSGSLGGAWSIEQPNSELGLGAHEATCHLLEWYKGGYELLEKLSGLRFIPLNIQPVKVFRSGKVVKYLSKGQIIWNMLRTSVYLAYHSARILKRQFSRDTDGPYLAKRAFTDSWLRLLFELKFRGRYLFDDYCIREPEGGYAGWITFLVDRARNSGFTLLQNEVLSAEKNIEGKWMLTLASGDTVVTSKLVLGESTKLKGLLGEASPNESQSTYYHALIYTDAADTIIRNRYIHCADDPHLHRVSFLSDCVASNGRKQSFWLVQFRTPDMDQEAIQTSISKLSRRYRFIAEGAVVIVAKRFERRFGKSPVYAARNNVTKDNLIVLRTIGDLSRNVLHVHHYQSGFP